MVNGERGYVDELRRVDDARREVFEYRIPESKVDTEQHESYETMVMSMVSFKSKATCPKKKRLILISKARQ